MANRRVLVRRRKSVRNIRKITRTMQLIATARFQAALKRATATKPYTEKLAELVGDLAAAAEGITHPLLEAKPEATKSAMVVITSNRGLCGSFNVNVLRLAMEALDRLKQENHEADVYMVGKKGVNYFRFLKRPTVERITTLGDAPRFDKIQPIANGLMDRFSKGELHSVHVAYMKFVSMGRQVPSVIQLLPLAKDTSTSESIEPRRNVEFEFSPEPKELLAELLPSTVRIRLFQCFTDAAVCEHIARMVAMKAATDAAGDMITALTRQYNRARQTQITMELLDIIGGANALV